MDTDNIQVESGGSNKRKTSQAELMENIQELSDEEIQQIMGMTKILWKAKTSDAIQQDDAQGFKGFTWAEINKQQGHRPATD
ncbi:hypothetical protein HHI36_019937 [Cryptolaemus montrouzieri]|uniref:Uncharacterized protein n=1 Tax=Cryptolaemus montrouzieri TaxID=559131 RepID=A0ABD2N982_9CUCU